MKKNKILPSILALSLVVQPLLALGDPIGSVATGITGIAGLATSAMGALQNSQVQMQNLVGQFTALQQFQRTGTATPTQFDLTKQQLSVALAEAGQCLGGAQRDYSKFKKAPKDNKGTQEMIEGVPNCVNYGAILDSINKNKAQLQDANKRMACLTNLQTKITEITESAKQGMNNLTQAANEVYKTRSSIIKIHQDIADKVHTDLNDPKTGFKKQLADLKALSLRVNNAINAGTSSGKDGQAQMGISARLKSLQRSRKGAANMWYRTLMTEVHTCFTSGQVACQGASASPLACLRGYAGNQGSGNGPDRQAALVNTQKLQTAFTLNMADIGKSDSFANVDVNNRNQFLIHVTKNFNQMMGKMAQNFKSQSFMGKNMNVNEAVSFAQSNYQSCFDSAIKRYNSDMDNEGPQYKSVLNSFKDEEEKLAADIGNLVDEAKEGMTAFRTSFNTIYNRDLNQFAANCTSSDNPYASADCLRKLAVTLQGGIEGVNRSIKMGDGSTATFTPGTTLITLQKLSLDQTGKPSVTSYSDSCKGFTECINVLDRYQAHHTGEAKNQEKQRADFVDQHNKNIDTALVGVSAQFSQATKMLADAVNGINKEIAEIGIGGSITTKTAEAEKLVKNETTGLYEVPTSMKAAMAGVGSYTEIGDTQSVTDGYNSRMKELTEKSVEAAKVKVQCMVRQSDIDALKNSIRSCDESICKRDRVKGVLLSLESLIKRSQSTPVEKEDRDTIHKEYSDCARDVKSDKRSDERSDLERRIQIKGITDANDKAVEQELYNEQKKSKEAYAREDALSCSQNAVGALDALAAGSRDSMKDTNGKLISALRAMSDACTDDPENPDVDAAQKACEDFKSTASSATAPTDEGETSFESVADEATPDIKFNNPTSTNAK